jgi:hypothetical protein
VAGENLPAFVAVTSTGLRANSSTFAHFGKVIGIIIAAVNLGFSGDVTVIGEVQNLGWSWTAGDVIFLNGNSLASSAPVSGFSQKIGTAKNSTTIVVELETPVLL